MVWLALCITGLIITLFLFFRARQYYVTRSPSHNGLAAIIAWLNMRTHLGIFLVFILFTMLSYNALADYSDYIPYSFPALLITIVATAILVTFVVVAILTYRDENRIAARLEKERKRDGV